MPVTHHPGMLRNMTRHPFCRIVALTTCLLALGSLTSLPAAAAAPPEPAPNADAVQARYVATVGVVNSVVQGAGEFIIGMAPDGTVTAKRLSGQAPSTVAYPEHAPYMTPRWHDAYTGDTVLGIPTHPGHPYVCMELDDSGRIGLEQRHPIIEMGQRYDQYDFIVETSVAVDCTGQVGYRYSMTLAIGARNDQCWHTYLKTEVIGGVTYVYRMIKYFDEDRWTACYSVAEVNFAWTATAIGSGLGLLWHIGDGAPSIFSYTPGDGPYVYPQPYDVNGIAWYN